MPKFNEFSLHPQLVESLSKLGFTDPTEIQEKAIPLLIEKDRIDFHGQAQTGTGKTLAFGIPLIQRIKVDEHKTQALVIAPTRELVLQICKSLREVAVPLGISIEPIYGGDSILGQIRRLKKGVHIVVGTPGRLQDHLRRKTLSFSSLQTLVLDEADIMLDMGFKQEVEEILKYAPKGRNIWLFSATVKDGVRQLMRKHMSDTVTVKTSQKEVGSSKTTQYYSIIPDRDRLEALLRFINVSSEFYGIIFAQTKLRTAELAQQLNRLGYRVGALHGDMDQAQRNRVTEQFRKRQYTILVATDVAARGIDITGLTHVINYSIPEDHDSYVHRIGRTGRAGSEGIAISFVKPYEVRTIRLFEKKFGVSIKPIDVPGEKEVTQAKLAEVQSYVQEAQKPSTAQEPVTKKIRGLLGEFDTEQLSTLLADMLNDKFFKVLTLGRDNLKSFKSTSSYDLNASHSAEGAEELILFLGTDDGVDKQDVINVLRTLPSATEEMMARVRVLKRRTFIKMPNGDAEKVAKEMRGASLCGRRVRVTVGIDRGPQGGFRGRGGNFSSSNNRGNGNRGGRSNRFGRPASRR